MIGAGTEKCGVALKGWGVSERKKAIPLLLATQVYKIKRAHDEQQLVMSRDDHSYLSIKAH